MELMGLRKTIQIRTLKSGRLAADLVLVKKTSDGEEEERIVPVPGEFDLIDEAKTAAEKFFQPNLHAW